MKLILSAALFFGLVLVTSASAAEPKGKKPAKKTPSTLPPTSKMIVVPPPSDSAVTGNQPQKLISSEMSGQDLLFFTTTVEAGRFQAYLVNLLTTKGQSDQIKALAGVLSGTQEQENRQIARLAATKGWTVSTDATAAQKAFGAELEAHGNAEFDKAVMDKLIANGQQSVSAYEAAAQSTDADIKNFSQQMLPLAKEKLLLVERMTGPGKAASTLFRTGGPAKADRSGTPKVESGASSPATPQPKPKPATATPAKPASTPFSAAGPFPSATPPIRSAPASPKPIPPPITN